MLVISREVVPTLVSVTACDSADVFSVIEPNARILADSETNGFTPFPLSVRVCGDVVAPSVMVIAAVNAPPVVGAK